MPNPLELHKDELDALHGLQTGTDELDADDPVWEGLEDLGLAVLRRVISSTDGSFTRVPTMTARGRRYPTS